MWGHGIGKTVCRCNVLVICALLWQASGGYFLCVFVPISPRSKKDAVLSHVALETWADPRRRERHNATVKFLSPPGAAVHPDLVEDTESFDGDVDTNYKQLPIRTFRMWSYLGEHWSDECEWFMKADADSYVNIPAVTERLSCFDSREQYYFGVTHAVLPAFAEYRPLYFGHGGSGYFVSRGLMVDAGLWSTPCLGETLRATFGDAMEDVAFAMCLRSRGIEVLNYGLHASEFIVNFHQARQALLNCSDVVIQENYWDAKPPPISACILVIHPIELPEDARRVHACIVDREIERTTCLIEPLLLAQQSEITITARGAVPKGVWDVSQFEPLHYCFLESAPQRSCRWVPMSQRCFGLSYFSPASSVKSCTQACCLSSACTFYQFHLDAGCWLGNDCWSTGDTESSNFDGWVGAFKHDSSDLLSLGSSRGHDPQERVDNWEVRCWSAVPGKYLPWFTAFGERCFHIEDAKEKCLETSDCDGLTLQIDMCGGSLWTLRKGRIGRVDSSYEPSDLNSLLMSRPCAQSRTKHIESHRDSKSSSRGDSSKIKSRRRSTI